MAGDDAEKEEMEKCPWCGLLGEAEGAIHMSAALYLGGFSMYSGACDYCGLRGPISTSPAEALKMWNELSRARWGAPEESQKGA